MVFNVHVLSLPLHNNKTSETQFNRATKSIDVVDGNWHVSFGTDGERKMTGRISGVHMKSQKAAKFHLLLIFCGLHQLDLVAQK